MPSRTSACAGAAVAALLTALAAPASGAPSRPVRVLIVDGQNNHDWRRTTGELRATLQAGRHLRRSPSPPRRTRARDAAGLGGAGGPELELRRHEVLVSQLQRRGLARAGAAGVRRRSCARGGGAVMVHAANNPFPEWKEWNQMIALGWRKADYGARVTVDDATGALVRTPAGRGARRRATAPRTCSRSRCAQPDHPIMRGLPPIWLHGKDQLSHGQRGPGGEHAGAGQRLLAPEDKGGTGAHEPMTWIVPFGQGRVVTTLLGHQWRDQAGRGRAPTAWASGPCSPAAWSGPARRRVRLAGAGRLSHRREGVNLVGGAVSPLAAKVRRRCRDGGGQPRHARAQSPCVSRVWAPGPALALLAGMLRIRSSYRDGAALLATLMLAACGRGEAKRAPTPQPSILPGRWCGSPARWH